MHNLRNALFEEHWHFPPAGCRGSSCLAVRHHLVGHLCQSINKHRNQTWPWQGELDKGVTQSEPLTSNLKDCVVVLK